MERPSLSFIVMNFVLLFALIGFVLIVFELHRLAFVFELLLLLVFMLVIAFSMYVVHRNKRWGWTVLIAALVFLLLNTFFVFLLTGAFETAHLTTAFFSAIGIVIALINVKSIQEPLIEAEYEKAKEYYPYIDKMEPREETKESSIEKTFTPGKFVASKKASRFHAAKCDWAKRISKSNQIWFNSEEEANAKGFEKDKCVG